MSIVVWQLTFPARKVLGTFERQAHNSERFFSRVSRFYQKSKIWFELLWYSLISSLLNPLKRKSWSCYYCQKIGLWSIFFTALALFLFPSLFLSRLRCGGRLRNSIYSASERILGLKLVKNGRLPVLRPVSISGNLTNGVNVTYSFILGDGSRSQKPSDQPKVDHIYDQPGSFIVSMQATNPITGSITVSEVRLTKHNAT